KKKKRNGNREAQEVFNEINQISKYEYFEVHYFYALQYNNYLFDLLKKKKLNKTSLHYACQQHEEAMMQYIFAIICENNWSIAHYYLGCVLYQLRLYKASMYFLSKAQKMNPNIPVIQNGYYAFGQRLAKYLEREASMSEEELHFAAVNSYRNRNWSIACLEFLQLLYTTPHNVNYQHNMAMVLQYGFMNYDGAEKYFKQSVRRSQTSHPDILRHYCQLLSIMKRYEDCKNYYVALRRRRGEGERDDENDNEKKDDNDDDDPENEDEDEDKDEQD
ncbi:hypothetical protein RFI_25869, partial [Reticulomyxa filosa]